MVDGAPRALVLLAAGAEEMETTIAVDVLRRGGLEVILAGVAGAEPVVCSRDVRLVPDAALDQLDRTGWDLVVLPGGGPGSELLAESHGVQDLLRHQETSGGLIAAICAAPIALVAAGVCAGRAMTSHPSVRERIAGHGVYREDPVVEDGTLITSRGPGTAFAFALALVARTMGAERAEAVRAPMMLIGG